MKLESFGEHAAKTACPGKIWFLFYDFYRKRCRILEWSIQFWVDISSLISRMDFILHISIVLNDLNNLATISLMQDHSKITKMHFWMIQRAKMEVFGHFLEFGLLDRLAKCFPTFGNITRSWRIIQRSLKCIFEWSKEPKNRFSAIFWSLICWIDLILHIMIVLNVFQLSATLPGHEGSFKNHESAFLSDPKSQKKGFWPFSGVWSVGLTWYCIL